MHSAEQEGKWLAGLPGERKPLFLAALGHELTVVARSTYKPQTEELDKPSQLRKINEVQHRVLACLVQLLAGACEVSFQEAIPGFLLEEQDPELVELMQFAWRRTKERLTT